MKKITEKAAASFNAGENFRLNNTVVKVDNEGNKFMYLWGNLIARQYAGQKVEICMQGYNTVTTRERLNGLAGVDLRCKNFTPYLNGVEISSDEWITVGA